MLLKIATNLSARGRGRGRGREGGNPSTVWTQCGLHTLCPAPRPYHRMTVLYRTAYRMYGKIGKYG
eukprot:224532-Chlamydomonas_euryale.AAC.1